MKSIVSMLMVLFIFFSSSVQIDTSYRWTWIGGDSLTTSLPYGIYGQKGIEDKQNAPGGRIRPATWIDASNNLWLFGGLGYGATTGGNLNDLWKYNTNTHAWTWVAGCNEANASPVYGPLGVEGQGFTPGATFDPSSWMSASGTNLYMYGEEVLMQIEKFGDLTHHPINGLTLKLH